MSTDIIVWSPGTKLEDIEKQVIQKAFRFYRENKTSTANALGISIRTLDARLATYKEHSDAEQVRFDLRRAKDAEALQRHRGFISGFTNPPAPASVVAPRTGLESERVMQNGTRPEAGVHVESAPNAAAQQAVSVSQRPEVQSVLPQNASRDRHHGRRR